MRRHGIDSRVVMVAYSVGFLEIDSRTAFVSRHNMARRLRRFDSVILAQLPCFPAQPKDFNITEQFLVCKSEPKSLCMNDIVHINNFGNSSSGIRVLL